MAKKSTSPPGTRIVIDLPPVGQVAPAALLVSRGQTAKLTQVNYATLADIFAALDAALEGLVQLERDPLPDIKTSADDVYKPAEQFKGYKDWQPQDYEWGFDAPSYQPPKPHTPIQRGSADSLNKKPATDTKSPTGETMQLALL